MRKQLRRKIGILHSRTSAVGFAAKAILQAPCSVGLPCRILTQADEQRQHLVDECLEYINVIFPRRLNTRIYGFSSVMQYLQFNNDDNIVPAIAVDSSKSRGLS
jgi:hypothetical protein